MVTRIGFQERAKTFLSTLVFDEADFIMYRLKYSTYTPSVTAYKIFRQKNNSEESGTVYVVGTSQEHRGSLFQIVWNSLERKYGLSKPAHGAEHFGEPVIELEDEDLCFIWIDDHLEVMSHIIYKTGYLWKFASYYDHHIRLNRK